MPDPVGWANSWREAGVWGDTSIGLAVSRVLKRPVEMWFFTDRLSLAKTWGGDEPGAPIRIVWQLGHWSGLKDLSDEEAAQVKAQAEASATAAIAKLEALVEQPVAVQVRRGVKRHQRAWKHGGASPNPSPTQPPVPKEAAQRC